ncbi:MAG: hypothetical protein JWN93_833 [Hyphomicrobiales bacterium]|nr:hypothetical protein [Hyphomicrobiales bacterium]
MKPTIAAVCVACTFAPASLLLPASASAADFVSPYDYTSSLPPRVVARTLVEAPLGQAAPVIVRRQPLGAPVPTRVIEQRIVQQPGVTTKTTRIYDNVAAPARDAASLYAPRPPRDIPIVAGAPYGGYLATSAPAYPAGGIYAQPMQGGYEMEDFE